MAKVSKITIGRLFNLGSYEHVRYEVTVEVGKDESAATVMKGLERLMEAIKPIERQSCYSEPMLNNGARKCAELFTDLKLPEQEYRCKHGYFEGTPLEYATRCQANHEAAVAKRKEAEANSAKARELLDDIGVAANWKDAKLDWK